MTNLTAEFGADFSQKNPVLLYMITRQQSGTTNSLNIDEYLDSVWPTHLFPKTEGLKMEYGESPYVQKQFKLEEHQKESEWIKLVGRRNFYALSEEKRRFLVQTAGVIKFERKVDIKKVYDTAIY